MNDQNIIKEQIIITLEEIVEQSQVIDKYQNRIPQIELDIVLENIRKLYTKYNVLNKLNASFKHIDSIEPETEKIGHPIETIIKKEVIIEDSPKTAKKEKSAEKKPTTEKETEKIPSAKTPVLDLFAVNGKSLADKPADDKKSIHENLTSGDDKSIAAKLSQNPIHDLKSAIGINEKFLFVYELFDGDMETYKTGIEQLNNYNNLDEAIKQLQYFSTKYEWDQETDAYLKLYNFIQRKYL